MGKKRIIKKTGGEGGVSKTKKASSVSKKRVESGVLYIEATYNNTKACLTDKKGNTLSWSSSGSLGFKGAKKATPFASAKVGELMSENAQAMNMKDVDVVVKGVGSGRESVIRGFINKGININSIKDTTPIPFNGPRPRKPRRV